MARVETVKISTGTIDHKVSGSGKVEAGKEVAVYTEGGQRVKEICVREGQSVEAGETLFLLDLEELEEQVLAAQQELEKIKLQNEDARSSQQTQQEARALAKRRAQEDYSQAVSKGDADVAKAKADWDAAERALQEFLRDHPRPAEQVGAAYPEGNAQKFENQIRGAQTQDFKAASQKSQGNPESQDGQGQKSQKLENLGSASQEHPSGADQDNQSAAELGSQNGTSQDNSGRINQEDPGGTGQVNQEGQGQGGTDQENQGSQGQENPGGTGQENPEGQGQGGTDQENQEGQGQGGTDQENQGQGGSAAEWDAQKSQLESAVAEAKSAYEAAVSARTESIRTAARAIEDAAAAAPADSSTAQNEISQKQQQLALGKLQDLQKAGGKVMAPVGGMVTQIAVTTGDFTTEGTAVRLADTSQGNRLVATVDKSNETYVQKGGQVTISPAGSKEKIQDFTISNVSVNKEDNTLIDISVDLPKGVLEPGTSAQIEIVQKSSQYSAVIPVQALYEEQSGYYVLLLREQQGVMGQELVAERIEVQVLDKNSTNAAIQEGLLTAEQEIIRVSSRSIGDGSRVRRAE